MHGERVMGMLYSEPHLLNQLDGCFVKLMIPRKESAVKWHDGFEPSAGLIDGLQ